MTQQFFTVKRTALRLDVGEGKLTAVRVGTRAIRVQADSVAQLLSPRKVIT